jgi:hypothetical protein
MQLPRPKNPLRKRDDGSTELAGLTAGETVKSCGAILFVWALFAAFTAVMFIAAQAVRAGKDTLDRPGDPDL